MVGIGQYFESTGQNALVDHFQLVVFPKYGSHGLILPQPENFNVTALHEAENVTYHAHGHKLRSPAFEKAQFATALGIIS
jgi:hypothetical protein